MCIRDRRLDRLLACQRGLPAPAVFAVREGAVFRGLAGCPPVDASAGTYGLFYQLLPACWGRGLGLAAAREALRRLEKLTPSLVLADTVAENTASVRILERLASSAPRYAPAPSAGRGGRWTSGTMPSGGADLMGAPSGTVPTSRRNEGCS